MPDPMGGIEYTWPFYAAFIGGYLLGSIPFGLLLTHLTGMGDIRKIGSGNIGATNVLRTGNTWLAALVLLLDALKGAAAVLIAVQFGPDTAVLAGGGAVLGHVVPVWLKFRGGKGVATAFGVMITISFPVGLAMSATWIVVAAVSRYSSLAAILSVLAAPVYASYLADPQRMELSVAIAMLVVLRHSQNFVRLFRGDEPKITLGRKPKD